jgi:tetratricopeptide (TPR) repeat protein
VAYTQVGFEHRLMGDPEAAAGPYQESIRIRERLAREHPNDLLFRRYLKLAYEHYASLEGNIDQVNLGHPEIARQYYKKAHPLEEADFADPQTNSAKFDYASYLITEAMVDALPEELPESVATLRRAAGLFESLAAAQPGVERYDRGLASAWRSVGDRLLAMQQPSAALAEYARAWNLQSRILARDPENESVLRESLRTETGMTRALMAEGDRAGALQRARQLILHAQSLPSPPLREASTGEAWLTLATVHRQFADCAQAKQAADESAHHLRPLVTGAKHDATAAVLRNAEALRADCPLAAPPR